MIIFILVEAGFGVIETLYTKSNSFKDKLLSPIICLFDFISVRLFFLKLFDDPVLHSLTSTAT